MDTLLLDFQKITVNDTCGSVDDTRTNADEEENYDYLKLKEACELFKAFKISSPKSVLRDTKNRYERYIYHIKDWSECPMVYEKMVYFLEMDKIYEKNTRIERLKLMYDIDVELFNYLETKRSLMD